MEKIPLYTIGHGTRKAEDFLKLLKDHRIDYLIDVRSKPYSRFNPQYNQKALQKFLESNDIKYIFMGDTLGGRPEDSSCYDKEGRVNYDIVKTKDFFLQGIERLKTAYEKNLKTAIMCSESNPCQCHRSRLIGRSLEKEMILKHIDEKGNLKDHEIVMHEINKGLPGTDLFGNSTSLRAVKKKKD